ncbi:ABC transporter related [Gallionella capsiferriformans ES-2]|jgi:ATP-binding cassette subfamily C protein|uniref:ABC transporter related n=2 Tax=Gallionella TaxID=96 RepID=D9SDV2_GALCS|nr:ABC transporter related [Gallionella capsiferriformans ES-2]
MTGMSAYLRTFHSFDPPGIWRAVLLNFAAAFAEGAGLLMLLPILSLAGVLGQDSGQKSWLPMLDRLFVSLGISWSIEFALLVFVVLIYIQSQLTLHRDRVSQSLQLRFGDHLRKTLYAAIVRANWSFLTGKYSAELLNTLTTEVQRITTGTYFLLRFFTISILSIAYFSVALWLSTWLTLLALAIGLVLWMLLRGADDAAKQGGMMLSQANRKMFAQIQEFLSAMKLVKIHGEELSSLYRFNREVDQVSNHSMEFQWIRTRVQAVYRVGGAIALAVVSYIALVWFKLPATHFLLLVAIFARMLPQLAEFQSGRQQLLHMLPAFSSWRRLMEACEANQNPEGAACGNVKLMQGITFERLGFSYPESHHRIIIRNLAIPARKTTAIIGVSGSGKTTLLDLLSGLLTPDTGTILIDGAPLHLLPGWQKSIAYIPQETQIQNGTIRDNLNWKNLEPTDAEIKQAILQSALTEFVQGLPKGLETEVGERGVKLSGGEKQRLALARALLRKPQLLILDEATNALDPENHRLVIDSIRALHGNLTVLIVTHKTDELSGLIDGMVQVEQGAVGKWIPFAHKKSTTADKKNWSPLALKCF